MPVPKSLKQKKPYVKLDSFETRKQINQINLIKSDYSSLYNPIYNDLNGKDIFANCDTRTILRDLGLNQLDTNSNSPYLFGNVTCKHKFCGTHLFKHAPTSLKRHEQICHTRVKGVRLWKCSFYSECKFGISEDLLLTYNEWNMRKGNLKVFLSY